MNKVAMVVILGMIVFARAPAAQAQIPQTMSYQGILTDSGDIPVPDGSYTITFRLYTVSSGGAPVWTEIQLNVPVSGGTFSILLGSITPITLPFDAQYWLGISVGLDPELAPRVRLASSPYSLNARSVMLPFTASSAVSAPGAAITVTNTGTGTAVSGTTQSTVAGASAVYGQIASISPGLLSAGVRGVNNSIGSAGYGVYGSQGGGGSGVYGYAPSGIGVYGQSVAGSGVYGTSTTGHAGYFLGNVNVTGILTKGAGAFKIDHPLDPQNKFLYHSFVESPEMKNVYDGIAVLDERGEACVIMPEWFEALNGDFRYQLTPIGAAAPGLYVAEKIKDARFRIAGGRPAMEVSWQVTGIRKDATANAHRIPVEEEKAPEDRGKYLDPLAFGQPAGKRIGAPAPAIEESEPVAQGNASGD